VIPPTTNGRVLVTRHWPELVARLAAAGISAAEVPTIEVRPPLDPEPFDRALADLARYDWIVFTSANAVDAVRDRLTTLGLAMPDLTAASVGPATTAAALEAWPKLRVSVQPAVEFRGAALIQAFATATEHLSGRRVLLPVSDRAAETVERGLADRGAIVDRVVAYQTRTAVGSRELIQSELRLLPDVVAFASPSAVEGFMAAGGDAARGASAVVIGPTTGEAALAAGLTVVATADPATVEGMAEALIRAVRGSRRGRRSS
jgi:uroporphyrinogen-III synthase